MLEELLIDLEIKSKKLVKLISLTLYQSSAFFYVFLVYTGNSRNIWTSLLVDWETIFNKTIICTINVPIAMT